MLTIDTAKYPISRHRGRRVGIRHGLAFLAIAVLFLALISYQIYTSYAVAKASATAHVKNLAQLLEAEFKHSFIDAREVVASMAAEIDTEAMRPATVDRYRPGVTRWLKSHALTLPATAALRYFDANGDRLYTSQDGEADVNIADRRYFQQLKTDPSLSLLFSEVTAGRLLGRPSIFVAKPIRDGDGEFLGIALSAIELLAVREQFSAMELGDSGTVALRRLDTGAVVVRYPKSLETDNSPESGFVMREALLKDGKPGVAEIVSPVDAVRRLYAYRRIGELPFYVVVGLSDGDYLAGWRLNAAISLMASLLFLTTLAFVFIRLARAEANREETLALIKRSRDSLHEAQELARVGRYEYHFQTDQWTSSEVLDGIFGIDSRYPRDLKHWLTLVAADSRAEMAAYLNTFVLATQVFDREYRIVRQNDGQERWVSGKGKLQLDATGQPRVLLGTIQDITEIKQQEVSTRRLMVEMETLLRNTLVGIVQLKQRRIVTCNRHLEVMFGYDVGELTGASTECLYDSHETFVGIGERAYTDLGKNNSYSEELMFKRKDGSLFWGVLTGCAIDANEPHEGSIWIYTDISARRNAELSLKEISERFDLAVRGSSDGIWDWKIETGEIYVSERWCEMLGYSSDEISFGANGWTAWIHPDDRVAEIARMRAHLKLRRPYASEYRMRNKSGEYRWFLNRGQAIWNEQGIAVRIAGSTSDITARKLAEEKLKLAANVFTHAREGIMITDADGIIIDVNETFTHITGYGRDEVLGKNPRMLQSGRQGSDFYAALWRDLSEQGHWYGEIWNRRKDGQVYAEMLTISAVRDAQGKTQQYVALFSDITPLKEHEQQLEHIAHYDALTSLPNRVLFADRLQQAMVQAQRRGQSLAVAYLDLDGFKAINDHHGHDAGDQLLVAISARMKQALREGDTLARLGGDEFVAVLLDLADIASSVPMLLRLLSAADQPVRVGDLSLNVSASLGVTFYPQQEDTDADQLLRQADQAMYQAKLAGRNRYHVFDAEQDRSVRGHHEGLERIRRALNENEFVLYYQPKVNMSSGAVIGAEALIRWQHPERGLLSPAVFLPVIEDHPLAVKLGEWVIEQALRQIEAWHAAGLDLPVSVNVGASQLQHVDFVASLRAMLAAHPAIRAGDLELEVLETSALEDLARVSQVIDSCRELGVSFALDDFGTGYSSLTYLKRLPVTMLKIDQSFVHDMLDDPDDLAILKGVLGLATAFHRQAIAEGVETVEHGTLLLQLGCQLAQGYGIARPMPADAMPAWAASWRPDAAWIDLLPVSQNDLPLLFAGVEHRAWIRAIEEYLRGERGSSPPLDSHQCHLGIWLDGEGRAGFAAHAAFLALEALHGRVHLLAAELCDLAAHGRSADALQRLDELHGIRDSLLSQLKALELAIRL